MPADMAIFVVLFIAASVAAALYLARGQGGR